MAEAVASIALETIRDLLLEEGKFLAGVADQVKELEWQLNEMKCFLEDADKRRHESRTISNWISEIRDLVYTSESAIERHAAYQAPRFHKLHQVWRGSKDMQENDIKRSIIINPNGEGESSAGNNMSRKTFPNSEMGDCFLGMEDEVDQLVHHIGKDTEDRIISVWGMGGSGKTAIVKKLYNETTSSDLSAWVCITQQCESRSVWEDVLRQLENQKKKKNISSVNGEPRIKGEVSSLSNSELIESLCELQREKRCLIVLDDLWELSHWDELKHPFIVQDLQSKILVTTQKQKVAEIELAVEHGLLRMDAALELLKNKAFQHGNTPGGKLPRGITNLVHLRCLRLEACEMDKLPSSMRKLVYMDTLDLTNSMNVEVPNVFKEMLRLKHLTLPVFGNEKVGNYRIVDCQVSIEASCDLTSEKTLEKAFTCPNLHALVTRSKLGKALPECWSDLVSSKLRFLDLFESKIEDDPMGTLGKLPCLIRLRLYWESFVGEKVTCTVNSFLHLKRLTLREGLSSISTLQTLVIEGMPELSERVSPSGQDFHKVRHVPSILIEDQSSPRSGFSSKTTSSLCSFPLQVFEDSPSSRCRVRVVSEEQRKKATPLVTPLIHTSEYFLAERSSISLPNLSGRHLLRLLKAIHAFEAETDEEPSLAVGNFGVFRKVLFFS
ncbi:hypothetical protein SASPL_132646 [Salvia splendens]|uniref:Disease resistance protein RPM1 n=1 Tax=Salvia splendens TaxID=180675 RepID=A0A8X8X2L9_SALSN|nr:hypothetical protein SASPL_132646 [Salvia splendens]